MALARIIVGEQYRLRPASVGYGSCSHKGRVPRIKLDTARDNPLNAEMLVGDTISTMVRREFPASRRREALRLGKKTFVYFTDEERKLIDQAAKLERRSISSFVAHAALTAAEETVASQSGKK